MAIKTVNTPSDFVAACAKAGIAPTRRQLSKWQRGRGKARGIGRDGRPL